MSKTKRKSYAQEEQMYTDFNRKNSYLYKKSKSEKKMQNALRSNDIDKLIDYEYDVEY